MRTLCTALLLCALASAQDAKLTATKTYWLALGTTGAIVGLDAYSTVESACKVEVGTPWLYGLHPQPARTALAMAGELAVSGLLSYALKRHHRRWWSVPLAYTATVHGRGASHNAMHCWQ